MRIIGLTGSIACGKSTVSAAISREADCRIIDGDLLSRELTAPDGAALTPIRKCFGDAVFQPDGQLDRSALGKLVFSDFRSRTQLDQLMAPLLRELTDERIRQAREQGVTLCFLDYPLLFEAGYDSLCDSVWCVYLPRALQLERLMARDKLSAQEASARINAVLSSEEKAARSQVVIDNSGTPEETLALLPALLDSERRKAAPRRRRSARYQSEEPTPADETRPDSFPAASAAAEQSDSAAKDFSHSGEGGLSWMNEDVPGPGSSLADWQREAPPAPYLPPDRAEQVRPAPRSIPVPALSAMSMGAFPEEEKALPTADQGYAPPGTMERPEAARRKKTPKKAAWRMPLWLMILLISSGFILLCSVTADAMMRAYLTRQKELHEAEQQAILNNYPLEYRELIEKYAAEYNLEPAFVTAIIRNESSFQPLAVSSVGARGLMQLMPDTAEWIAGKLKLPAYSFERMFDPEANIRFGCWYLNYLSTMFRGDPICVTCAYHAGQGTVTSWLSDPLISDDGITLSLSRLVSGPTKTYAERVTKAYGIYQVLYFETPDNSSSPAVADPGISI